MRKHLTRKRVILLGLVALAIGIGSAAFAYFRSTGSGTGTATTGTPAPWQVTTTAPGGGPMAPGAPGSMNEQIGYTVLNNSTGYLYLAKVNIKVANADGSAWSSQTDLGKPACTGADFQITVDGGTTWYAGNVGVDDARGAGTWAPGNGTSKSFQIRMLNGGGNQDNCKSLAVPLYLYAS